MRFLKAVTIWAEESSFLFDLNWIFGLSFCVVSNQLSQSSLFLHFHYHLLPVCRPFILLKHTLQTVGKQTRATIFIGQDLRTVLRYNSNMEARKKKAILVRENDVVNSPSLGICVVLEANDNEIHLQDAWGRCWIITLSPSLSFS